MRSAAFLAAISLLSVAAFGRDLKTVGGTVFKNITINKKDATGLEISHDDGVIFLDFRNLAEAERKEFGYDPTTYVAGLKQKAEAEQRRREQALAAQQARAARARAQALEGRSSDAPLPPYVPTNQTGVEYTIDSPGFRFGPYDYYGRGFSNAIPPRQGGPVPYVVSPYAPYPYYYGPTWGPTIIRRR
jgi:hypothetical protein